MPPRSLVRAFLVLYVTLGLVILVESVRTVLAAHQGAFSGPDTTHAMLLGGLEALAAAAFLVPRTMRVGAGVLLAIFATAFVLHAVGGHPNLVLLVYASGVLFVRVHGVAGYHWSAAA
jgi:hypothetical protein